MSVSDRIPYPGLRAFDPSESDLFFGREGCVDEMLDLLSNTKFLAVLGTSGSGKSSLVRTGLLDSLELGFLQGTGSRWLIADMHPGGRPLHNMAKSVDGARGSSDQSSVAMLESFLSRGPRSLVKWCEDGNLPEGHSLLLLVDQFEELFRYQDYAGQEKAEAFVALLLESIKSDLPIYLVITMRSEYLGACALMPGLAERINRSLYLTRRMTREECKQAIEGPAAVLDFAVELKLVTRILNDLATFAPWDSENGGGSLAQLARRADQLPLMQHVLNRLWESARARGGDCVLRYADYDKLGGLRGAIDAHGEEVLQSLPTTSQREIETVFRALISGNTISDALRNPRRLDELMALSESPESVTTVIDAFRAEGCNFLRPPPLQRLDGETIVDLGHESLIRQWSAMEGWLANESRSRAAWRRLVSATEAHAAGEGDLLSGLDLDNARDWWSRDEPNEAWAESGGGDFAETKAFLDRSIDAEMARREAKAASAKQVQRSLRKRAAAYLTLAVISVAGAIYAFDASQEAIEARTIAEEAESAALSARDEADRQRASVERTEELIIESANDYLVDFASQLRRTIGVPKARVHDMFAEAEAFLDRIEVQIGDPTRLYAVRAELALQRARDLWDRDEFASSLDQATAARQAVEIVKRPEAYTGADVDILLRAMYYDFFEHVRKDRLGEAAAALLSARRFLDENGEALDNADATYWAARFEAGSASVSALGERWGKSHRHAIDCGDHLEGIAAPDLSVKDLELLCVGGQLSAATELERLTPELVDRAERALDLIPEGDKSRGDWQRWSWVQGRLAVAAYAQKDPERSDSIHVEIIEQLEKYTSIEPSEPSWRSSLAGARLNFGYHLAKSEKFEPAYDQATKSAELYRTLESTFEKWTGRATNYRKALNNAAIYAQKLEKRHKDPKFLVELAKLHEERLHHLDFMVEAEIETNCQGCTFDPLEDIVVAHGKRLKLGRLESGDLLLDAYDRLVERAWDHLDEARTDLEARRARLFFSVAAQNLATYMSDSMDSLPDEDAERLSAEIPTRLERYLNQFPRDGYVRQIYGNFLADRATLLDRIGQKDQAIAAMKDAMTNGSYVAAQRMATWYESGEGPLESDPVKAEAMDLQLSRMAPGPFNILMNADNLFTEEVETQTRRVNIFMPTQPDGLAVDEVLWRARVLAGIELDPEEVAELRKAEEKAKQDGTMFPIEAHTERSFPWFKHIFSAENMVAYFYEKIEEVESGEDPDGVTIAIFSGAFGASLRENVRVALRTIIRNREYQRYDDAMDVIVGLPGAFRGHIFPQFQHLGESFLEIQRNGERFVTEVLAAEFDEMDRKHVARILSNQGNVYFWWGNEAQRKEGFSDLMAAMQVAPDDPKVLHFAGYAALEIEHLRGFAVDWLERARDLVEPGSEEEEDSMFYLGAAYVLNDRPNEGIALIKQGMEISGEPSGETYYYLTEGLRRLGRMNEALAAAEKMTGYTSPAPRFEKKARNLLAKLETERNHEAVALAAAEAILTKLTDTDLDRKNISLDRAGIAIRGYDPVAFHKEGVAKIGRLEHHTIARNAVWLFASDENRTAFLNDVERYIPVAGGFKAMMGQARHNIHMHALPEAWRIAEDRVFFLHSESDRKEFDRGGALHAQKLLAERRRVKKDFETAPSPPSIFENLLMRLSDSPPTAQ